MNGVRRTHRAFDSGKFWERRYARGGTSGAGSYGVLAEYKASFLNGFVAQHAIQSIAEFGCGDGNQLALSIEHYRKYLGFDVSTTVIGRLRARFGRRGSTSRRAPEFFHVSAFNASTHQVELALSLDVIFHLVEDAIYAEYMRRLLSAATRFVLVYSSNEERPAQGHVRHRNFSAWISSSAHGRTWRLVQHAKHPMGCSLRESSCGATGQRSFASF